MNGIRFADVQARPAEFLNLTSLALEEFEALVAPFEAAFQDYMAVWRLDAALLNLKQCCVDVRAFEIRILASSIEKQFVLDAFMQI